MKYCEKCFRDLEKDPHQEWCPYAPKKESDDLPDFLKDLMGK